MELVEIAKITIPPTVVAIVVYFMMKSHYANEEKIREQERDQKATAEHHPLKLQAMERLILLLERLTPHNLMSRVDSNGLSAVEYAYELMAHIRMEFDHNVAQQLYISDDGWKAIVIAKDWVTDLIQQAGNGLGNQADSLLLKQLVLETAMKAEELPTTKAIWLLKKEVVVT